jgi:hypothetical protein
MKLAIRIPSFRLSILPMLSISIQQKKWDWIECHILHDHLNFLICYLFLSFLPCISSSSFFIGLDFPFFFSGTVRDEGCAVALGTSFLPMVGQFWLMPEMQENTGALEGGNGGRKCKRRSNKKRDFKGKGGGGRQPSGLWIQIRFDQGLMDFPEYSYRE